MKNIVYFDLETRRSAAQVGGWHETAKMGMSVGVTFSTASNAYAIYTEDQAEQLIEQLRLADLITSPLITASFSPLRFGLWLR